MSLQFLNPIYLLGLLGVGVPVLVHLLTRRRQQRLPFSAVYLLHQAQQRSIRRARPNRLWLLLFRCLGIACLSLALASPLFSSGDAGGLAPGGPAANVFILDDSYSMVHQALDGTVFQSGQEVLISLLKNFPGPQAASLVLASSPARVIQDWTADTDRLVRQVRALSPSYQTTNIGQAVSLAADLLVTAPHPVQRVFLLTDLDKNGWRESDFPSLKDFPVEMHLLDFSGLREGANRSGVEQVEVSQEFLTHSRMVKIKSHIRNFSTGRSLNRLAA
ncbi:MAG: BatA domain-containing protein, partial [Nitrospinaceae bacterium]